MNIKKMYNLQKVLVNHIEKEHPRMPGEDRSWPIMQALLVEWAECQNEWRGFKFWSQNQEPNITVPKQRWVDGNCISVVENPLLEETADVLHLFFTFAIEMNWSIEVFGINPEAFDELKMEGFQPEIHGTMIELTNVLSRILFAQNQEKQQFRYAWFLFYCIATLEFGFTSSELEQAYISKNEVNHERQKNGY